MSGEGSNIFRSTGEPGFSSMVSSAPERVIARKLVRRVQVQFADADCTVRTPEGEVHAHAGDAIVTGVAGEHWRVSQRHFTDKYQAVPPTKSGQAGTYASLPNQIFAVRMREAFDVVLADGESHLHGRPGDWLVDYGDGSLGIISPVIFSTTYEIIG
jgi:hypothetical protein